MQNFQRTAGLYQQSRNGHVPQYAPPGQVANHPPPPHSGFRVGPANTTPAHDMGSGALYQQSQLNAPYSGGARPHTNHFPQSTGSYRPTERSGLRSMAPVQHISQAPEYRSFRPSNHPHGQQSGGGYHQNATAQHSHHYQAPVGSYPPAQPAPYQPQGGPQQAYHTASYPGQPAQHFSQFPAEHMQHSQYHNVPPPVSQGYPVQSHHQRQYAQYQPELQAQGRHPLSMHSSVPPPTQSSFVPPPPPPPSGGFATPYSHQQQPQYQPRQFSAPSYNQPRQQTSAAPAKRPRAAFFCESCTKGFDCEEDYDIHVAEDHVTCSHPGCGFSGREEVVRAHKVRHTVNSDSPEEIEAWIAMRKFKFPRRAGAEPAAEEPKVVSKLEKFIRGSIRQARLDARKQRLERDQKQPCIHWERTGKCRFGDTCSFAHAKQGVCTFYVNHGRCRHGDGCKYKHVKGNSQELQELRNPHGGLLKRLISVEVTRWENSMIQVLRHCVNHNFYQPSEEGEAPADPDAAEKEAADDELFNEDWEDDDASDDGEEDAGEYFPVQDEVVIEPATKLIQEIPIATITIPVAAVGTVHAVTAVEDFDCTEGLSPISACSAPPGQE